MYRWTHDRGTPDAAAKRAGLLLITAVVSSTAFGTPAHAQDWRMAVDPGRAGWDAAQLAAARALSDSLGSTAVMVVHRGTVIAAWGAISHPIALTSVRKSVMATLLGAELRHGGLSLDATLRDLQITDRAPLSDAEGRATLGDVLAARSGVYRPAAQEPPSWARVRPAPGTHAPGTHWFYNNWSFNVVGTIYEQWRRRSVYQGFEEALARPLGMQDWTPVTGALRLREPSVSMHPAHAFRLSARDLARIGELHVRDGRWGGRQVLAAGWRDSVRRLRTDSEDPSEGWRHRAPGAGYGWLWWINPGRLGDWGVLPTLGAIDHFAGIGAGAQLLLVAPERELVIVHLVDREGGVLREEAIAFEVAEAIVRAMPARAAGTPRVRALAAAPWSRERPPLSQVLATQPITAADLALAGRYDAGSGIVLDLFEFEGGMFLRHPRLGDAELSRSPARPEELVGLNGRLSIRAQRDSAGVTVLQIATPQGPLSARRVP